MISPYKVSTSDFVSYAMTNKELTDAVELDTGTITPGTGITLESASYLKKQGSFVNGYIAINSCTATLSTVVATLPNYYKPSAALTLVGVNTSDSSLLPFYVFGNGEIKLATAVTSKNIRLPFTFSV